MILVKQASILKDLVVKRKNEGKKVGFVPTMGALHPGHLSLIEKSKQECDITICSIFVNPTQFNDKKDYDNYPVTIGNDILMLEKVACDILFLPAIEEIYPNGTSSDIHYDLGAIEFLLEGKYRPGHFQGVCQVVHRLLNIVEPHQIFLGQKDYQQCMVLNKLVSLLKLPVVIKLGETYRETSGLAMSSRNMRLKPKEKDQAVAIFDMLQYVKSNLPTSDIQSLETYASDYLKNHGFHKVDYVSIAHAETLEPVTVWNEHTPLVVLVAAFIGDVRLIDNMVLQH